LPWGLGELARRYSPDWYHVYKAAGLPRHRWYDADAAWHKQYALHRPRLLAGARQVLRRVAKRHHIGLVTSGERERVTRQLREFRLARTFAACVCSGDTPRRKPHPAPLQLALRHLELKPAACVYVGDSAEDLEMAGRAGVPAIAVLGPFPTEKRLRAARPEFLLPLIAELPKLLEQLQRGKNQRSAA
jgi:HAD superfamily hydrolase (TIGR01549 family)